MPSSLWLLTSRGGLLRSGNAGAAVRGARAPSTPRRIAGTMRLLDGLQAPHTLVTVGEWCWAPAMFCGLGLQYPRTSTLAACYIPTRPLRGDALNTRLRCSASYRRCWPLLLRRALTASASLRPGAPPEFPPHTRAADGVGACPLHGAPVARCRRPGKVPMIRGIWCFEQGKRVRQGEVHERSHTPSSGRHLRAQGNTAAPCIQGKGAGALGGATPPDHSSANCRRILPRDVLPQPLVEACTMHRLGQHRGVQVTWRRKNARATNMAPKPPGNTPKIQDMGQGENDGIPRLWLPENKMQRRGAVLDVFRRALNISGPYWPTYMPIASDMWQECRNPDIKPLMQ
ncbi:hypothetical protein K438DRAFT_2118557 [Mycena galopus ATCC 62051]|nr:hypothetical protein K438DRAFT_2118557 [Mycena galopus ATCC 62051]